MFTEYIFENKKYELAVRDLKATLFDIVAIEEAKLSSIEEKIEGEYKPERKEELRELCSQQDECLKKVLTISNQLSEALIKLDSYSKSLKELEDENIAEIIASMGNQNIQKAYQKDLRQGQATVDSIADEMISKVDEITDSESLRNGMVESIEAIKEGPALNETAPVGNVRVVSSEDAVSNDTVDEVVEEEETLDEEVREDAVASEEAPAVAPEVDVTPTGAETVEEVPVASDESVKIEVPTNVITPVGEEVNEEVIASEEVPVDVAEIDAAPTDAEAVEEVSVASDEPVKIEDPTNVITPVGEEANEEVIASEEVSVDVAEVEVTPTDAKAVEEVPVASDESVKIEVPTNVITPVGEEASEEVIASEEVPADVAEVDAAPTDAEAVEEVPVAVKEVPANETVIADEAAPVISPELDTAEEAIQVEVPADAVTPVDEGVNEEVATSEEALAIVPETEEAPVVEGKGANQDDTSVLLEPLNENVQTPVEVPSSDDSSTPEQSDSTNEAVSDENSNLDNLEAIVDKQTELNEENKEIAADAQMNVIQKLKFIKSSNDVAKAILTSKKQITNLRKSRVVQEALLKVRGSIASNTVAAVNDNLENEQAVEQQLIDNGLLEASTVDKQKQIEQMLEQANALYKEGKLDEAQAMYDQISVLNKELQQGNAVTK